MNDFIDKNEEESSSDFTFKLSDKVSVRKLATILGISVNALYQDKDKGRFGDKEFTEMTVGEAISIHRTCLLRGIELKRERMQEEIRIQEDKEKHRQDLKNRRGQTSDSLISLQEQALQQKIRLERSKEMQTWLGIAKERNQLLVKDNLLTLYTPFINLVKNGLVSLASDYPEVREKVDEILENWYKFGQKILEQSETDIEDFVGEMMDKGLDDDMLELQFIPEKRDE